MNQKLILLLSTICLAILLANCQTSAETPALPTPTNLSSPTQTVTLSPSPTFTPSPSATPTQTATPT
ncbi:MAG TPA: hypothetical protein PK530_19620, partial [Anaerolineales bacterium]|nr:hypothetical protein [Anaerolineales bacterium]